MNLISSLTGTAWKLVESFPLEDVEKSDAFSKLLKMLDKAFEYDNRVQLPGDFDKYFSGFQRHSGQTLLDYCTQHDELYNRLADHKVTLPGQVQGWHLLRRAGLTREQRQLVLTQAPTLEKNKVQETLFLVLGQDYKTVAGHSKGGHRGKGRGYAAFYVVMMKPIQVNGMSPTTTMMMATPPTMSTTSTTRSTMTHRPTMSLPRTMGTMRRTPLGLTMMQPTTVMKLLLKTHKSKLRSTTVPLRPILMLASASTTSSWHVATCPSSPSAKLVLDFPLAFRQQPPLRLRLVEEKGKANPRGRTRARVVARP